MINQLEKELVELVEEFLDFTKVLFNEGQLTQEEYDNMIKRKVSFLHQITGEVKSIV